MRAPTLLLTTTLVATLTAAAPFTANAELFRWVDERGGINYSDRAPAKSSNVKDLSVVQDRLSVYSPDRATLEMVQRAREHGDFWPRSYERLPPQYVPVMPSASGGPSDPCLAGNDINCYGPVYYAYPGFYGRRGGRLVQPVLPRGVTAGNIVGFNGFTPGLSAQAQSLAPGSRFTRSAPIGGTSNPSTTARQGGGHRSR
ncbi:MAG: DUF4124 domain-containing protein [Burkholderiales bacterium]